jgi:hypothetical protein
MAWWALPLLLAGCLAASKPPRADPPAEPATKGLDHVLGGITGSVRDSVYQAVDRQQPAPAGYGLYTVLLTRSSNAASQRVLIELFATTVPAREAAMEREALNLIQLPARQAADAARTLQAARQSPQATAATLMQRHYDYGQAARLMAVVCRPERGADVMRACGATPPEGPLLVTTRLPLDPAAPPVAMLVVNLERTPPAALREVMAAYQRQITRAQFADRAEVDSWRLVVLDRTLQAAALLPFISKAYAAAR